jgi:hypothetical protein
MTWVADLGYDKVSFKFDENDLYVTSKNKISCFNQTILDYKNKIKNGSLVSLIQECITILPPTTPTLTSTPNAPTSTPTLTSNPALTQTLGLTTTTTESPTTTTESQTTTTTTEEPTTTTTTTTTEEPTTTTTTTTTEEPTTTTTTTTESPTTTTTTTTTTIAPAYFKVGPTSYIPFIVKINDLLKINSARRQIANQDPMLNIMATIIKEPISYNQGWSYHYDPDTIEFFEIAAEVCDASFEYVELHLAEVGGAFLPGNVHCNWSSYLIEELIITEEPTTTTTPGLFYL